MSQDSIGLSSPDLCVPIYLNSNTVLDLLAIFDDGFAKITEINTSITESREKSRGLEAKIGASNLFALFGISAGGHLRGKSTDAEGITASIEKVHTPTSLFSKMRSLLSQNGLLKGLDETSGNLHGIKSGDFIEINASLMKNPIVDFFQGLLQMMTFFLPFVEEEKPITAGPGGGKKPKPSYHPKTQNERIIEQMESLVGALSSEGTIDLIGKTVPPSDITIVLSSQIRFFLNESYDEILDGEYRVLGKVVRIIAKESLESVNLLRKTAFSRIQDSLFHQMTSGLEDMENKGLKPVEFVTEVKGPAIHLIPIAIYV